MFMGKKFKSLKDENFARGAKKWMGVGFEFVVVVGGFCWLGNLLGRLDKDSPRLGWMIVGFFIGFGVMIYIMVKRAQSPDEQEPQDKENNQKKE